MKKKNKVTDIIFVLDRSGSMGIVKEATIKGYNDFLKKYKKGTDSVYVTTVLFDDEYEVLDMRKDIRGVKYLTNKTYYTRGCTALMDAIGKTITDIDKKVVDSEKVIFVIITDGMENASREYNKESVKRLIDKNSNFEFVFMGANVDSYAEASSIGIKRKNIANFSQKVENMDKLFKCASMYIDNNIEDFCLQDELSNLCDN